MYEQRARFIIIFLAELREEKRLENLEGVLKQPLEKHIIIYYLEKNILHEKKKSRLE